MIQKLHMVLTFCIIQLLILSSAPASEPMQAALPAQQLACISGESEQKEDVIASFGALSRELAESGLRSSGIPFFVYVKSQVEMESEIEGDNDQSTGFVSWRVCAPIDDSAAKSPGPQGLEYVTAKPTPVLLILDRDQNSTEGCASAFSGLLSTPDGDDVARIPRSAPVFGDSVGSISVDEVLAVFTATDSLDLGDFRSNDAGPTDSWLADINGLERKPRPLLIGSEQPDGEESRPQTQVAIACLVEMQATEETQSDPGVGDQQGEPNE